MSSGVALPYASAAVFAECPVITAVPFRDLLNVCVAMRRSPTGFVPLPPAAPAAPCCLAFGVR